MKLTGMIKGILLAGMSVLVMDVCLASDREDWDKEWLGRDQLKSLCSTGTYARPIGWHATGGVAEGRRVYQRPEECDIIDQITAYKHDFKGGDYDCRHFSQAFVEEANKLGYNAWIVEFGCWAHNYQYWFGDYSDLRPPHQNVVIQLPYPHSALLEKYCVVDPMNNDIMDCWIQEAKGYPVKGLTKATRQTLQSVTDVGESCNKHQIAMYFKIFY